MLKRSIAFGSIITLILISCASYKPVEEPYTHARERVDITHIDDTIRVEPNRELRVYSWPCPNDMMEIKGDYCPDVKQTCIKLDKGIHNVNGYVKCDEFSSSECLSKNRIHMRYCIDVYEYPDKYGEMPEVMVSWNDMAANCAAVGKRLCTDTEWTFACEGEEMLPYPYGLVRDDTACNIDHPQRSGFDANKKMTPEMVAYLDQRVASGFMPGCVSPFMVHDMTGNVDEFVVNSSGRPYKSALKGGHWVWGARARCRPSTIAHNESFAYYAEGGRCCKNTE